MKKTLALVMALALLLPMLMGIGTAAAEEPMEISLCLWDLVEFGNDEMARKIEEDLNIKITVMPMNWDNEIDNKLLWAASESLPDIISTYTVEEDLARFYSWQTNGLTRSIPEDMLEKYPAVKALVDSNPYIAAVKEYTGTITFIPRPFSMQNTFLFDQGTGFYYRKDWLANVGLEVPKTLDEFYEVLNRFTNNDPDGNGRHDTYGLVLNGRVPGAIFSWWGMDLSSWEVDETDGLLKPVYMTDRPIEAFEFLNKCYNEGLIDPEYTTNSNATTQQKFASGTFGVYYKNVDDLTMFNTLMKQFAPAQGIETAEEVCEIVGVLSPITLAEGDIARWPAITDLSGAEISAKVSDEKLEKILELYEYLMQPEIQRMLRFGFEGKEYTLDGDKVVPSINPNTNLPYEIGTLYPSARIHVLPTWGIDIDLESDVIPQPVKDMAKIVRDEYNPIADPVNLPLFVMSTPAKDALSVDTRRAYNNFLTTAGDVAAEFKQWQEEVMLSGMDEAIKEANAKAEEMGLK